MLFHSLLQLDTAVFHAINNLPHAYFFDSIITLIRYGTRGGLIYAPLLLILLKNQQSRRRAYFVLASCISTYIIVDGVLKYLIRRARPFSTINVAHLLSPVPTSYSFPSGETAMAFAVAMICTLLFKNKWRWLWWVWAVFVGLARIYMGHHYPSDVIAGALIGAFISYLAYFLKSRYIKPS